MKITEIDTLPKGNGVYKFYDKNRKLLYIGKAVNLRSRVKSYFSSSLYDRPKVQQMIPLIKSVEIVETNNEIEALVLESNLIKKHKPYYNSDKKDDKSYSWIYISTKEKFPTVKIVKNINKKELKKGRIFGPYPNSKAAKRVFTYLRRIYPFCTCKETDSRECLYFHLGLCPGPYHGHISEKEYRKNINEIIKFLNGRKRGHVQELQKKMKEYSKKSEYEKAAELRDKINDLTYLGERTDFGYADTEESYRERRKKLLKEAFEDLRLELGLRTLNRIECYDISNLQGKDAYGSMTVAEEGEIVRNEYRIFKIRKGDTPDDPHMLLEVIQRRLEHKQKYKQDPDIILIDGGPSQLSVLKKEIPPHILLLGISKGKRHRRKGGTLVDEFWSVSEDEIQRIEIENKAILIDLRDEAHRFAILHHKKSRQRNSESSILNNIEGVGDVRKKKLLKEFKNIEGIKKANVEELDKVIKNGTISQRIFKNFNP